jgi:hypothetical protein
MFLEKPGEDLAGAILRLPHVRKELLGLGERESEE